MEIKHQKKKIKNENTTNENTRVKFPIPFSPSMLDFYTQGCKT